MGNVISIDCPACGHWNTHMMPRSFHNSNIRWIGDVGWRSCEPCGHQYFIASCGNETWKPLRGDPETLRRLGLPVQ